MKFNTILLKLSGESLAAGGNDIINPERLQAYARQIKEAAQGGCHVAIVIGGGNIFRGLSGAAEGLDRIKGDQMGMLSTVINSLALCSALEKEGQRAQVFTAIPMFPIGMPYGSSQVRDYIAGGGVAILAGGTGNPYFTTDTGASLRAIEIHADVMLKGTRVDGIYTADPEKDPQAKKFDTITYKEILDRNLRVMDLTATVMCMENHMPIYVFNMDVEGNLAKVLRGEPVGTLVKN